MTAGYLMESGDEALRLDLKTDPESVARQARWAGVGPGMRVADLGCGSGLTTSILHALAQPGGETVGVDLSEQRIAFARARYGAPGITFTVGDVRGPLPGIGTFDFVWMRFVLEYYLRDAAAIVGHAARLLRPGGTLCLLDLDHNALSHHEMPARLDAALRDVVALLGARANFDPYAGRKLYAHLYDLGFERIRVSVEGHHLIYGELRDADAFNWMRKIEVAPQRVGYGFPGYPGGYEEFREEFEQFFKDPRRFTYSPLIVAVGTRP